MGYPSDWEFEEARRRRQPPAKEQGPPKPLDAVMEVLKDLSDSERLHIFETLRGEFCIHCGCKQPENPMRFCQCWNDE